MTPLLDTLARRDKRERKSPSRINRCCCFFVFLGNHVDVDAFPFFSIVTAITTVDNAAVIVLTTGTAAAVVVFFLLLLLFLFEFLAPVGLFEFVLSIERH